MRRLPPEEFVAPHDVTGTSIVKILQVAASIAPRDGGPTTATININRGLRKLGSNSVILTTDADGSRDSLAVSTKAPQNLNGSWTWYCKRSRPYSLKNSWSMARRTIRQARALDVMHVHGIYLANSIHAYLAHRITNKPYVIQPHGTLEPYQQSKKHARKTLFNLLIGDLIIDRASAIIAASESERANILAQYPNANVAVVPLAVTEVEPQRPEAASTALEDWLAAPQHQRVVFMGRLAQKKRPDLLARAWNRVAQSNPDARLLFIGPEQDWTSESLLSLVEPLARGAVGFMGPLPPAQVAWCLKEAGIFVLPSENENFGISVIEAMWHGCAIISTSDTASTEHVELAQAGITLKQADDGAISAAVGHLLANSSIVERYGLNGIKYAQQNLTWNKTVSSLLRIYDSVR